MLYSLTILCITAAVVAVPLPADTRSTTFVQPPSILLRTAPGAGVDVTDTLGPLGNTVEGVNEALPVDLSVSALNDKRNPSQHTRPILPRTAPDADVDLTDSLGPIGDVVDRVNAALPVEVSVSALNRREPSAALDVDLGGLQLKAREAVAAPALDVDLGGLQLKAREAVAAPALDVDLGGLQLKAREAVPASALDVELGGLQLKQREAALKEREAAAALDVDLGGLQLKKRETVADPALDVDLGGLQLKQREAALKQREAAAALDVDLGGLQL